MLPVPMEDILSSSVLLSGFCYSLLLFTITSWILHYFPHLLHSSKRKGEDSKLDPRFSVVNIAHRGSRLEGLPENTLGAFQHAVASGAHLVEFDVWLTADDQVVVFHDEDLERMTGVSAKIIDLCYHELPPIRHDPALHWGVDESNEHLTRHIPTLHEVLTCLPPHVPVIVELKMHSQRLIERVHHTITVMGVKERVIWFSLEEGVNACLRAFDASIPTITSAVGMLRVLACHYLGLLPFVSLPADIMGVTADEVGFTEVRELPLFAPLPDWVCHLLAAVLGGSPPRPLMPPSMFKHLRRRGIPIFLLGVNTEDHVKVAAECGVTAVLTDRPRWLNTLLSEGNLTLQSLAE